MRIALCISGLPRRVEKAFSNIKANLIDPNQPDIFMHSWIDLDNETDSESYRSVLQLYGQAMERDPSTQPFIIKTSKQFPFANPLWPLERMMASHARSYTQENFVTMLYSSWYSVQQANLLKELHQRKEGFTYDCVIRARFDIDYNMPVVCEHYPLDRIHIPSKGLPPEMTDDRFAFGPNHLMNAYSSIFNLLDLIHRRRESQDGIFCGETLVYETMKMLNLPIEAIPNLQCGHVHDY